MRCLDLCCCAGGASDGYTDAGFDVEGVDFKPQPNYPYKFHRLDALAVLHGETYLNLVDFDFIHASPPCQTHTCLTSLRDAQGGKSTVVDILDEVVDMLVASKKPFVVENVIGATLDARHSGLYRIVLCGSMFGLKVRRHRAFWSNMNLTSLRCDHRLQGRPVGVYGRMRDQLKGVDSRTGELSYGGRTADTIEEAIEAMGFRRHVPWGKLKEAIPPAYTSFIGGQVINLLTEKP